MLQYLLQKIINKKWMILSQLIGIILLIGIAASNPMYLNSSLSRMLTDEFANRLAEDQSWPFEVTAFRKFKNGEATEAYSNMDAFMQQIPDAFHVKQQEMIEYSQLSSQKANSLLGREDASTKAYNLAAMSELENHIKLVGGRMYSEEMTEGKIEVIVSETVMVKMDMLLNEEFQFATLTTTDKKPVVMKIVGVYKEANSSDTYFEQNPEEMLTQCFMSEALFQKLFLSDKNLRYHVTSTWYSRLSYQNLVIHNMNHILDETYQITGGDYKSYIVNSSYTDVLSNFKGKMARIRTTFWILQIPLLVLLCSFLFMISGQMLKMEQSEISVMKSRGASRRQIIGLYFSQSLLLAFLGLVIGIPLGALFTTALGSTNEFLEFSSYRSLDITINGEVFIYAIAAAVLTILVTIIPVLSYSNISIVNLKQQKYQSKKPLWERLYLDVILLGVSLYGYYIYSKDASGIVAGVATGKGAEPLLYLGSSIFVLSLGMLYLRVQPLLIRFIYFIGHKHWKPAVYTSFLQTMRMGKKQHFIMLFIILMVSLGMFDSVVARTIVVNAEKNIRYLDGADVSSLELWRNNGSGSAMGANQKLPIMSRILDDIPPWKDSKQPRR